MGAKNINLLYVGAAVLVVLIAAGVLSLPKIGSIGTGTGAVGVIVGGTSAGAAVTSTGTCAPNTDTTDMKIQGYESVSTNSDGHKTTLDTGAAGVDYYLDGETSPYVSVQGDGDGFVSTATDPPCGSKGIVFFENATFYNASTAFDAKGVSTQVLIYADRIPTITLSADNETNLGVSTGMNQSIDSGEKDTNVYLNIKSTTDGAVFSPCADILVCVDTNQTAMYDMNQPWITGGVSAGVPGALSDSMDKCWTIPGSKGALKGTGTLKQQLVLRAKSGQDPNSTDPIYISVIDAAPFMSEGKMYCGYEDLSQGEVGATRSTFFISPGS